MEGNKDSNGPEGLISRIGKIIENNNPVSMNYLLLTGGITSGRNNNNNVVFCLNPTTYIVGKIKEIAYSSQKDRNGTVAVIIEDNIFVKKYGKTDAEVIKKPLLTHIFLNREDKYFIPISSEQLEELCRQEDNTRKNEEANTQLKEGETNESNRSTCPKISQSPFASS